MDGELVFALAGFGDGAVPYRQGWDTQRLLHGYRADGLIPDTCLLLEHQPVYTAGRRTSPMDRPVGDPGAPVVDVDRGGKITWHGRGQLVGYPRVELDEPVDVIAYVRALEEALIRVCVELGVGAACRVDGRSGVWLRGSPGRPDRKIAAIGIRVSRHVTMHGFALNCDCDLSWYDRIVACGIRDATVTTLSAEARRPVTVADATAVAEGHLADALGASSWRSVAGVGDLVPAEAAFSAEAPVPPGGRLPSAAIR